MGDRSWIVNAQVRSGYARTDIDTHVSELARLAGLEHRGGTTAGVGLLTAADVDALEIASDDGVRVDATVGVHVPIWAAASGEDRGRRDRARSTSWSSSRSGSPTRRWSTRWPR